MEISHHSNNIKSSTMKVFKYFFLLIAVASCSTDPADVIVEEVTPFVEKFEISVNGELLDSYADLYRIDDTFTFKMFPKTEISFNKNGKFGYVFLDLNTFLLSGNKEFYSFTNFSSNYFNFNVEEIDEVNRTVKGSFSGTVYFDSQDLNSEGKYVSGTFAKKYTVVAPLFSDLRNTAKINGNEWTQTNKYLTKGIPSNENIIYHAVSDDAYKVMIKYNIASLNVGQYDFSSTTVTNAVQLAKFDVTTNQYINYNCVGTLKLTQKEQTANLSGVFIIKGTYSFTAVNPNDPNDVVQVTDGTFKFVHTYF